MTVNGIAHYVVDEAIPALNESTWRKRLLCHHFRHPAIDLLEYRHVPDGARKSPVREAPATNDANPDASYRPAHIAQATDPTSPMS